MTSKKTYRSLFLAALMVLSIFVGSIAFAGSAAAASNSAPEVTSAVEHGGNVQIGFNSNASAANGTGSYLGDANFTVYINDTKYVNQDVTHGINSSDEYATYTLNLSRDVTPADTVKVHISNVTNDADKYATPGNVTVKATSQVVPFPGEGRNSSATAYVGEVIALNSTNTSDNAGNYDNGSNQYFEVFHDGNFQKNVSTGFNSSYFAWDTAGNAADNNWWVNSSQGNIHFTLRDLGLDASLSDTSMAYSGSVDLDVSSNVGSRKLKITADYANNDSTYDSWTRTLGSGAESTWSIGTSGEDFNVGGDTNYDFTVTDLNTGVEVTTDTLSVDAEVEADASFQKASYSDQRGDIVNITMDITEGDSAVLTVQDEDKNYQQSVKFTDDNEDGQVTLSFNTYDQTWSTPYEDSNGDKDTLDDNTTGLSNKVLAALPYEMNVTVGADSYDKPGTGDETDVSQLVLSDRSTSGVNTMVAPSGKVSESSDVSEYATSLSEVSITDDVLLEVDASGLEGFMANNYNVSDLNDTIATEGLYLNIKQVNVGSNADPKEFNASDSNAGTLVKDLNNNKFYVVLDPSKMTNGQGESMATGEDYEATLTLNESSPYVDDNTDNVEDKEEYTTDFSLVKKDFSVDGTNSSDVLNVEASSDITISGDTTIAPKQNVTVRVRSAGNYLMSNEDVPVQDDGTWSTSFDFSDKVDTDFTVDLASSGWDSDPVDGYVMEAAPTTTTTEQTTEKTTEQTTEKTTEQTTEKTTEQTTEATTMAPTTTEAPPTTTSTQTPGFTMGLGLIALLGAALLALRKRE